MLEEQHMRRNIVTLRAAKRHEPLQRKQEQNNLQKIMFVVSVVCVLITGHLNIAYTFFILQMVYY